MANYETKMSLALLPGGSPAELKWLRRRLAARKTGVTAKNDGATPGKPQGRDLWFYGDSINLDEFCAVLAAFQLKFTRRRYTLIVVRVSFCCSRPLLDAFGGTAHAVYAGQVFTPAKTEEQDVRQQVYEAAAVWGKPVRPEGQES